MKSPEYSIVVPVYNQLELTKVCIQSVIEMSKPYNYELIVVANGCNDGTEEYILDCRKKSEVNIVLCSYPMPVGGGEAINVGFRLARAEYIITINNDTKILWDNWIYLLREPFDKDEETGISGPLKLYSEEVKNTFLVFFCVMVRRSVLNRIGLLDTDTFKVGFGEDIDFCQRAERFGYQIVPVPVGQLGSFPIYHNPEGTVKHLPNWGEIVERNRKILMNKYYKKVI